ncbi:hypothetical protein N1495_01595 [Streptococcus didelphis]|uniref:Peptidase M13 N-terminal domain-containing protein n=1 Tax=Streptococcus didelphis TaxID=102886 RepID=A0ABY9LFZ2_9STRE|nr:hypothetical protein [Streptococcus didelphis]WMB27803.1 hypothetical protein N1496_07005 [Streptococcus didelphis]WMB29732.1 hypothetical protein N1495_01595 [Streptococcus didelphis]
MKKKSKIILALSALIMAGSAYGAYHFLQPKDMITDPKARIESNFYQAINKSWLAKTQIPSDRPSVSAFSQLQDKIKDEMTSDIQQLASGKEKSDIKGMDNFLKFYQLTTDYKAREKEGSKSFKPTLEALEKLSIIDDLSEHIVERTLNNDPLPFDIAITPDLKNTSKNMVTLAAPELFLMSADYYQDKENKEQMTELFSKSAIKVLTLLDYSEKKPKS